MSDTEEQGQKTPEPPAAPVSAAEPPDPPPAVTLSQPVATAASPEPAATSPSAVAQSASSESKKGPESTDSPKKKTLTWPQVAYQLKVAGIVFLISTGLDFLLEFFFPGARDGVWSFNQDIVNSVSSLQPFHLVGTFYGHLRDLITGPVPDNFQWSNGIGWIFISIAMSVEFMFVQAFSHGFFGGLVNLGFLAWAAYLLLKERDPGTNYLAVILLWPLFASILAAVVEVPVVIVGLLFGHILHGIQTAAVLGMGSIPLAGLVSPARSIAEHNIVEGALKRMEKAEEHAAEKTPPA